MMAGSLTANTLKFSSLAQAVTLSVISLLLSAAALIGIYLAFFDSVHPEFRIVENTPSPPAMTFKGSSFRPVVFQDGGHEGEKAVITELADRFPEDHAILMRPILLQANRFPFLELSIEGLQPGLRIYIFWKSSESGTETHYLELDPTQRPASLHNLFRSENWRGTITEIAIGFFGDLRGEPVKLEQIELKSFASRTALLLVWQEWTNFAPWTQSSVNSQRGIAKGALVYPNLAATCWLILATLLTVALWLLAGRVASAGAGKHSLLLSVATCWLVTWLFVDGVWQYHLVQQNAETLELFAGKTEAEKMAGDWDGKLYLFASTIRDQYLPKDRQTIKILWSRETPEVWAGRLRYHLLPEHHGELHLGLEQRHIDRTITHYEWFIVIGGEYQNFESDPGPLQSLGLEGGEHVTPAFAHRNYVLLRKKLDH